MVLLFSFLFLIFKHTVLLQLMNVSHGHKAIILFNTRIMSKVQKQNQWQPQISCKSSQLRTFDNNYWLKTSLTLSFSLSHSFSCSHTHISHTHTHISTYTHTHTHNNKDLATVACCQEWQECTDWQSGTELRCVSVSGGRWRQVWLRMQWLLKLRRTPHTPGWPARLCLKVKHSVNSVKHSVNTTACNNNHN